MKIRLVLFLALAGCGGFAGWAAPDDGFAQGLEWSRAGQFPEAAAALAKSAAAAPAAGTFVNLGLAEWQCGHAGQAILAWERAQWIDPYDRQSATNLSFARQVAQVDAPELKWFELSSTWLPPSAWLWLAGGSLWLAVGAMVLPGIFRRRKTGWTQACAALAAGIFMFSLVANEGVVSRMQLGIIVRKNAPLRLTPTHSGEVMTRMTSGEPARLLHRQGDYCLIRTAEASGWVESTDFKLVCPSRLGGSD